MKKIALLFCFAFSQVTLNAQKIEDFLAAGKDGGTLLQSYLSPAFEGTIYNLSNGWYRTAKTHRKLGFDITLNASLSSVPTSGKSFIFNNSDYETMRLKTGDGKSLPTAFGGKTSEVLVASKEVAPGINGDFEFDALNGVTSEIGVNEVPAAMIQAGIGLPFKTDITVRYLPEVGSKDFKTNLIGFGLKHNILQYFPVAKRIPLVDVSLFAGYTKLTSQYIPGQDQSIDMEVTSFTGQVLGSVDLKIINFYLGVGFVEGKSNLDVTGDFEFTYAGPANTSYTEKIDEADLPKLKNSVSGMKTTAGMSLNLGPVKIFGDYTLQEYNTITAGLAFSFR